jgi:molecular chaperone DnaK
VNRLTLDFGIDLGTTNSSVAELKGTETAVVKNNEGAEYTPSVVWCDKKGKLIVGREAKERCFADPSNANAEFKLQMGTTTEYIFARNGRLSPEDLSAEVLKSLKRDVQQRTGDDLQAAVITVPAAFELPQCDATKRAAKLAGIELSPLLNEPVAAAMAYGFQSEAADELWLVYDFGGGTFDSALLQVKDGLIRVLNHAGDNHLGGKLIDWDIVNELLVPAVVEQFGLRDFNRGNAHWAGAFAKLKGAAEAAKIRLSHDERAEISIDFLYSDDRGQAVEFDCELKRLEVERLAEPYILRSINLCKKVLVEKNVRPQDVEKVLLVGGPTLMPYVRSRLSDPYEGLGVPIEFRVDPLTVVARGAAIFAGTQRLDVTRHTPAKTGELNLELIYKPIGPDVEPLVGGRIAGGQSFAGYSIEFLNSTARPPWRSGGIQVGADGVFHTTLWAEKGRKNTFSIEVTDSRGVLRRVVPDRIEYTVGISTSDQTLPHSIGVALADESVSWLLRKGELLPAKGSDIKLKTTAGVRAGHTREAIRIPIIEGGNEKAGRNKCIRTLEIHSDRLQRDIPANTDIEVTLRMDESRSIYVTADIPYLDQQFEMTINDTAYQVGAKNLTELQKRFELETARLEQIRGTAGGLANTEALASIKDIDDARLVNQIHSSLNAAAIDANSASESDDCLFQLKVRVDEIEDLLQWPSLLANAQEQLKDTDQVVEACGTPEDRQRLVTLEQELREALRIRDADSVQRKIEELWGVWFGVQWRDAKFVVDSFYYFDSRRPVMTDSGKAARLADKGNREINSGDLEALRSTVFQLWDLLPSDERQEAIKKAHGSTVIH